MTLGDDEGAKAIEALERAAVRANPSAAPDTNRSSPHPRPPKPDPLEELAKLAEQLRPEPRARWRPGPLGVALLGLLFVSLGAVAATRLSGRKHASAKPLLPPDDVSRDPPWTAELPHRETGPLPIHPGIPATSAKVAGPVSDAKAIDDDLEREFGSGRPTIPGPTAPTAALLPSWVKEVTVPNAADAGSGPRKLGGRYGDHLRVQLRSSLDSRLCGSGPVEAVLVRPYLVDGSMILPPRTLAFGQCSTRGDRFLLTFTRLRLPDGTEAQIDAVALDGMDGKPGVLASRRIQGERSDGRAGLWGEIARGTASTVLSAGTSAAGLPGQLVNSAGQTAINDRHVPASTTSEDTLLLDSRPVVDLFVAHAF
jgi:hypothetical protein